MKCLKWIAFSLAVCGFLLLVLGPPALQALKSTAFAQAVVARGKIKGIIEKHGHEVVWERIDGAAPSSLLYTLAIEQIEKRGGWKIPTQDYSPQTRRNILPTTLIHVKEVHGIASHGEPVFFFSIEFLLPAEDAQILVLLPDDTLKKSPDHHHGSFLYYYVGKAVAWGDLSAFPLENYFPFEEMRERQFWVEEARTKAVFWSRITGGASSLLGLGILAWFYFPAVAAAARVTTSLRNVPLRWRPAWSMTGIPLITVQEEHSGGDIPVHQDSTARERVLLILCLLYLYESDLEEKRTAARAERDVLHQRIMEICSETEGGNQAKTATLLGRFPRGSSRTDLRSARALLREARMIDAEKEISVTVSPAPVKKTADVVGGEKGADFREKVFVATDAEVLETRWLYGFLEDIDPYIKEAGGDPLIAKTIILWGFLRPKTRTPFVAGSYGRMRHIRSNVQRKGEKVRRVFGRDLRPEEIGENFVLLQKGGVIIESGTHSGRVVCTLNDDEKTLGYPWCEVIRIINRARRQLLSLRSGGRR